MQETLDQLKLTTAGLEEELYYHRQRDAQLERRADYMYSYVDYDNDRARIKMRFIKEINKKTTLKDIGDLLDQLILNEKAKGSDYYDPAVHMYEYPKVATKDYSNFDFSWSGKIFNAQDPLKPLLLEDASDLDKMPRKTDIPYRDILRKIAEEDKTDDHSTRSLTED